MVEPFDDGNMVTSLAVSTTVACRNIVFRFNFFFCALFLAPLQDGTNALMAAASNGHLETATTLVKAGAALDKQNSDGHSALMFAYNGRAQVCCLLMSPLVRSAVVKT